MSRIHLIALLALVALVFTQSAFAQRQGVGRRASVGSVYEDKDVAMCGTSGGGTRIRESNCDVETTTLRTEMEIKLALEIPAIPSAQCAATTTIEYQQVNTAAHLEGRLEILDCAAASGDYRVAVRVKEENGEDKVLEFPEKWQRSDDKDVPFMADYPIGDTELVSVRLRGLTCTCSEPPKSE